MTTQTIESELKQLFVDLYVKHLSPGVKDDLLGRDLIVTPYNGQYGLAGWVICLEGSPPRGTLLVPKEGPAGYFDGRRTKSVLGAQLAVVQQYRDRYLTD